MLILGIFSSLFCTKKLKFKCTLYCTSFSDELNRRVQFYRKNNMEIPFDVMLKEHGQRSSSLPSDDGRQDNYHK